MDNNLSTYLAQHLAYCGFVVADVEIAQQLQPDLLHAPVSAVGLRSLAWLDEEARKRSVGRYFITFANGSAGEVPVLARSDLQLHRRIGELLGRAVLRVRHVASFVDPGARVEQQKAPENADQPPAWQCTERDEWFRTHGLKDPQKPKPARRQAATG